LESEVPILSHDTSRGFRLVLVNWSVKRDADLEHCQHFGQPSKFYPSMHVRGIT